MPKKKTKSRLVSTRSIIVSILLTVILIITLAVYRLINNTAPVPADANVIGTGQYAIPALTVPSNAVRVSSQGALQTAINNAGPGTVIVVTGNFGGEININGKNGSANNWIWIVGDPSIRRPSVGFFRLTRSSYIGFRNLKIQGNGGVFNKAIEILGGHHYRIWDNEITGGGEAGISTPNHDGGSDHIDIRYNDIHGNAINSDNCCQGSGVSLFQSRDLVQPDTPDGYKQWIIGNKIWNNYINYTDGNPSLSGFGVTDGNCIIIDVNIHTGYQGKSLIMNNICSDNGGVGAAITVSRNVDVINNSFYQNVKTRVNSVGNNGEIMCNGGENVRVLNNVVVVRGDNPTSWRNWTNCPNTQLSGNIWVGGTAPASSTGQHFPAGTQVFQSPNLNASIGNWTTVGPAAGKGAVWPISSSGVPVPTSVATVAPTVTARPTSIANTPTPRPTPTSISTPTSRPSGTPVPSTQPTPISQPGSGIRIEAENYISGGQGEAYFDKDRWDPGAGPDKKQVGSATVIGWFDQWEWMVYGFTAPKDGLYEVVGRAGSVFDGKQISIQVDQKEVSVLSVPKTADWNTLAEKSAGQIYLTAGFHTLSLQAKTQWQDIDWIELILISTQSSGVALPSRVQAESYMEGGQNVAYFDKDQWDIAKGPDIKTVGTDKIVGWYDMGEWMKYQISSSQNREYTITTRVASAYSGKTIAVEVDAVTVATIQVPNTGSWSNYQVIEVGKINLTAGIHTLRLIANTQWQDIDWIEFK